MQTLIRLLALLGILLSVHAKEPLSGRRDRPLGQKHLSVDRENESRRLLNQHVIAIDELGYAIEPYDYLHKGHSIGKKVFKRHWGGVTKLQVKVHSAQGTKALKSLGLTEDELQEVRNRFPANSQVFRDVAIEHMLQQARESGQRIVVFVHGGLNNLDDAILRAETILREEYDPSKPAPDWYPIFVCWPSALMGSYWQQLWEVRNGVAVGTDKGGWSYSWRVVTLPIYLGTDLMTSVVRMPRVVTDLAFSYLRDERPYLFGDVVDAHTRYFALKYAGFRNTVHKPGTQQFYQDWLADLSQEEQQQVKKIDRQIGLKTTPTEVWNVLAGNLRREWEEIQSTNSLWKPVEVSKGQYQTTLGDQVARKFFGWIFLGPKLAFAGLLTSEGAEAWGMMRRRVDSMFHHEGTYRPGYKYVRDQTELDDYHETNPEVRDGESTGVGAMSVFFRSLQQAQYAGLTNQVDLYGHSMGTLVCNRALLHFPKLRVQRIVYMAAACSIKEFAHSVVPFLLNARTPKEVQFYNLCLHPQAEGRDGAKREMLPRGSLLIWIDDFLESPHSFEERVLGHFDNALLASRIIPPSIQGQMHFVAMGAGPGIDEGPQEHGKFTKYQFWRPDFATLPGHETARRRWRREQ